MNHIQKHTVAICDTQPITAEGLKIVLSASSDLVFTEMSDTLAAAMELAEEGRADILIIDKSFGIQGVLDWIGALKSNRTMSSPAEPAETPTTTKIVVWGVSMTEAEALRLLQAGARGIIRKTANLSMLVACLRTVANGRSWMEDCVFRDSVRTESYPRSELTAREQQVMELVEQGHKNKEIAIELGIRPGTVKIHLKHIFEKTGVRGRYGLALSGLKNRGVVSLAS